MKKEYLSIKDVSRRLAENVCMTQKDAWTVTKEIFEIIKNSLREGIAVRVVGFGIFEVIRREEKILKHPKNGRPIRIPAKMMPHFRTSWDFKQSVTDAHMERERNKKD